MAAPGTDAGEFENWLNGRLDSLEVDREVYGSYILGVLQEEECDEEKEDAIRGILSAFVVNIQGGVSHSAIEAVVHLLLSVFWRAKPSDSAEVTRHTHTHTHTQGSGWVNYRELFKLVCRMKIPWKMSANRLLRSGRRVAADQQKEEKLKMVFCLMLCYRKVSNTLWFYCGEEFAKMQRFDNYSEVKKVNMGCIECITFLLVLKVMCIIYLMHNPFFITFFRYSWSPGYRQHDRKTGPDCSETERGVRGVTEKERSAPGSVCQYNWRWGISLTLWMMMTNGIFFSVILNGLVVYKLK